jgi:hypothetical protein
MEKPKVNLIEDQKIDTTITDVTGYEAEQLLRKYGYQPQQFSTREEPQQQNNINHGLTFEEMVAMIQKLNMVQMMIQVLVSKLR